MTINVKQMLFFLGLAIQGVIFSAATVQATLGEAGGSVSTDSKALSAVHRTTTVNNRYAVREIQSDSVTVREYVSPSNVVFGVAWNGIVHPDLDQLLGSYAGEYRDALGKTEHKPGNRSGREVKTGRAVVQTWGHMRNLQGRAYVPALVPQGVTIDEIR